jgi:hypothetical protein
MSLSLSNIFLASAYVNKSTIRDFRIVDNLPGLVSLVRLASADEGFVPGSFSDSPPHFCQLCLTEVLKAFSPQYG